MIVDVHTTRLFDATLDSAAPILVHEGGAGSSKTYSILQTYLVRSFDPAEAGSLFSVVRRTGPALTRSARRDFEKILTETETAPLFKVNKTEGTFRNQQTGTTVEFMALDDPMKAHGPRRDRLFCNEANELSHDDYRALAKRTRGQIIIDYNPSFQISYIYSDVLTRPDCEHVTSTYLDNTYLSEGEIREIEADIPIYEEADGTLVEDRALEYDGPGILIRGDVYQWSVYGLGRRGAPGEAIYPAVYEGAFPEGTETALGLDFGYNHAMTLSRVAVVDREGRRPALHVDELFHETLVLNSELIERAPALGVAKHERIWCDSARPDNIREWQDAGYDAEACFKGPGSVYSQVQWVKKHDLIFTPRSYRGKLQHQNYRWKKRHDGVVMDEPVKLADDSPDGVRYGAWNAFAEEVSLFA